MSDGSNSLKRCEEVSDTKSEEPPSLISSSFPT
jgi:hypothetical protein